MNRNILNLRHLTVLLMLCTAFLGGIIPAFARLRGQLHGGGAGKPFLQVLRRVTGHQPSLGEDEDGLTHRLHLG